MDLLSISLEISFEYDLINLSHTKLELLFP